MDLKVCFIGAGNLATHLAKSLQESGCNVIQVYSRKLESAKLLADKLNAGFTNTVQDINNEADIYFIALKDSVVAEILGEINFENKLIVHCSGSLPISLLEQFSGNLGVFYPLQTFSKNRYIDFKSIPVFIEANSKSNEKLLMKLATGVSESVTVLDSDKRKYLHMSAVYACNFVNHFYTIAAKILATKNISFDVLKPLVLETANKVQGMDPELAQTGPAIRFDENIISSHLENLKEFDNYAELYNSVSKSIFAHYNKID